jgi:hypothetical protein
MCSLAQEKNAARARDPLNPERGCGRISVFSDVAAYTQPAARRIRS